MSAQEADALLAHGKHAEARLVLLRYLEGNDRDASLHLALVRACLGLGDCHLAEAVKHARCAQHSSIMFLARTMVGRSVFQGALAGLLCNWQNSRHSLGQRRALT